MVTGEARSPASPRVVQMPSWAAACSSLLVAGLPVALRLRCRGDPLCTDLSWGPWLRVAPLPQPVRGWASLLPRGGRICSPEHPSPRVVVWGWGVCHLQLSLPRHSATLWSLTTTGTSCGDCLWETTPGQRAGPAPLSMLSIAGPAATSQPFHIAKLPSAIATLVAWGSLRWHP